MTFRQKHGTIIPSKEQTANKIEEFCDKMQSVKESFNKLTDPEDIKYFSSMLDYLLCGIGYGVNHRNFEINFENKSYLEYRNRGHRNP